MVRCFWLLLLIYIGSNQMLKAQDTAQVVLTNHYPIDICGIASDRDYTISINIGEVKPSDSLFGFTFIISYNPSKFNFRSGLYMNTLSQFFEIKVFNSRDTGLIIGNVGTYENIPSSGNKALIAITGRFLGICPDTGIFRLVQLDFTSEFKKIVNDSDKYVVVQGEVQDKPNRSITASFESDTVIFNEIDSIAIVTAKLNVENNTRLNNIEFELVSDDDENFRIEEIKSITEKLQIDSTSPIEKGLRVYTTTLDDIGDESVFEIKLKEIKRAGVINIKELKLTPIKVNDCSCIKELIEGKTNLKGNIEKDTLGITEFENKAINGYYNEIEDKFIIETETELKEILIYNMSGNLIKKINVSVIDRKAEISADMLGMGVYMVTVRNIKDEIKNIVMIKN